MGKHDEHDCAKIEEDIAYARHDLKAMAIQYKRIDAENAQLLANVKRLQQERDFEATRHRAWAKIAAGRGDLLTAYRLGKRPRETAFEKIEEGEKLLGFDVGPKPTDADAANRRAFGVGLEKEPGE